jgi:hypothetical protein
MSIDAASPSGNLETARKAVEDTAAVGAGLWLSYLFVLFYLAVGAGAVTHADMLLQKPVKLPFLNIELPLLAFFFLAPLLFLLTHAYTLVHLVLGANRVTQFNEELRASREDPLLWRRQLPSNIFVQFLGAPEHDRYGPFGSLGRAGSRSLSISASYGGCGATSSRAGARAPMRAPGNEWLRRQSAPS